MQTVALYLCYIQYVCNERYFCFFFEVYLASSVTPIVIFSDHNPLTFIHKIKNKNQRLLRWSLMLQEQSLDIRHIKGKDNIIPDALSTA